MVIDEVMTIVEAGGRWHVSPNNLKSACRGQKGYPPRFSREESRQSGRVWLITRSGMERLYGKEAGV